VTANPGGASDRVMERYTVRVSKDYLGFCAAHFIVFDNKVCERLHGHNYGVAAEIEDDLREDNLVFDFIELKKILKGITDELDHRMLVPLESKTLRIEVGEKAVRIASETKEWIVPTGDCALLPIENSTAELLARWIALRLREALARRTGRPPRLLRIDVHESPGQTATYTTTDADLAAGATGAARAGGAGRAGSAKAGPR
jgi:6-pyruvoyltetrahydropterin/6-carboxytetrahydropterin synthase